jgi:hypothetical protein
MCGSAFDLLVGNVEDIPKTTEYGLGTVCASLGMGINGGCNRHRDHGLIGVVRMSKRQTYRHLCRDQLKDGDV